MREWPTDSAATSAFFSAWRSRMSGFFAPARTARPTPDLPSFICDPETMSCFCASSAMPSSVRITTSARLPAAMSFNSAWVAWNSARRDGAAASSTPLSASVLMTVRSLKAGFDGDIDVVRAAVDVAEELRLAEGARAVRHAQADVGIARDAEVDARVEIVEQLPGAAAVLRLVALLHERHVLGIGKAAAEA